MIYIADNPLQIHLESALAAVSEQRRQYALRYVRDEGRRLSVAAYVLLCHALKEEFGITSPPEFAFTENGKPYLRDFPHIQFSLSHCREAVACAVAASPVGIDVESISAYDPALLPATMSAAERERILGAESPAVEFTRLWTAKESVVKMNDLAAAGISLPSLLESTESYRFTACERIAQGYVCTACHAAPQANDLTILHLPCPVVPS